MIVYKTDYAICIGLLKEHLKKLEIQGGKIMISSLIWIMLVVKDVINPDDAPWSIYLPICLVETVIYFKLLTKWGK